MTKEDVKQQLDRAARADAYHDVEMCSYPRAGERSTLYDATGRLYYIARYDFHYRTAPGRGVGGT